MKQTLIHVQNKVTSKVKRENRDGRETLVLPSYAAKAGTVLNNILYTREELESSYAGLNRTPAPFGHPTKDGKFIPAMDPEALARNHVFAWNENARWDGERIALDVVIDEERAKESDNGRKVLNAIKAEKPISTSTGLLCRLENEKGDDHDSVARDIVWDHVALLLDETPAISTDQGVGLFVNAKGKDEEINVINSMLDVDDNQLDWAIEEVARALEKREQAPILARIKTAILEAFTPLREPTETQNQKGTLMADEKQFEELSAKVNALSESMDKIGETISGAIAEAVKPLTDQHAAMVANAEAADKAELDGLVETIVKANILDEDSAKDLPLAAARKLAEKAKPKPAAALNSAFAGNQDSAPAFQLPKSEGAA